MIYINWAKEELRHSLLHWPSLTWTLPLLAFSMDTCESSASNFNTQSEPCWPLGFFSNVTTKWGVLDVPITLARVNRHTHCVEESYKGQNYRVTKQTLILLMPHSVFTLTKSLFIEILHWNRCGVSSTWLCLVSQTPVTIETPDSTV